MPYPPIKDLPYPLPLLLEPGKFVAKQMEIGGDAMEAAMTVATRMAMEEHGPRVAIVIGEAMKDCSAVIGEFSDATVEPNDLD